MFLLSKEVQQRTSSLVLLRTLWISSLTCESVHSLVNQFTHSLRSTTAVDQPANHNRAYQSSHHDCDTDSSFSVRHQSTAFVVENRQHEKNSEKIMIFSSLRKCVNRSHRIAASTKSHADFKSRINSIDWIDWHTNQAIIFIFEIELLAATFPSKSKKKFHQAFSMFFSTIESAKIIGTIRKRRHF